ncbi:MAG: SDR family oxidoreductase [Chloroflexota bacterium]
MKIVVFGASGETGLQILEQAIEDGHAVTAFVRNKTKLAHLNHDKLSIVVGDALDETAVEQAIEGQDVVLSALGAPVGQDVGVVRSKGTQNIVNGMRKMGVKRLLSISTIGIRDSIERMNKLTHFVLNRVIGHERLAEAHLQEEIVEESALDWTVIRPPRLTNGHATLVYQADPQLNTGFFASLRRADLADFLLEELSSNRFNRQFVTVMN